MKIQISLSAIQHSVVRPYLKDFDRTRYSKIFNLLGTGLGRDKYRIYVKLGAASINPQRPIHVPHPITKSLSDMGYEVDSYLAGIAVDASGKRRVRIGKLLKDSELKKLYNNDPQRALTKAVNTWVVISRHPYDILGMSFDRGWTSCMNLKDGSNKEILRNDVRYGTLVAYLIKETDKNINSPISRIAIRPYVGLSGEQIMYPGPTYTTESLPFRKTVNEFCKKLNVGKPSGSYYIHDKLYDDNIESVYHIENGEDIMGLDDDSKIEVAKNPNADHEILSKLVDSDAVEIRLSVARNPRTSPKDLSRLANDDIQGVRTSVADNANTPAETLSLMIDDEFRPVLRNVALNRNTPSATLHKLATDPRFDLGINVAYNTSASPDTLDILAEDSYATVREAVAQNTSTRGTTIDRLSRDDAGAVRHLCISNPNLSPKILMELAKSDTEDIRESVADGRNTSQDILEMLAHDESYSVRLSVAHNRRTGAAALDILSYSTEYSLLREVTDNSNVGTSTLERLALSDNFYIRTEASQMLALRKLS